jgi:hypothetical protein
MRFSVDLNIEPQWDLALLLQFRQSVKERWPVRVARKIVVSDEELMHAQLVVLHDYAFKVVRRAEAALMAMHIDYGAE